MRPGRLACVGVLTLLTIGAGPVFATHPRAARADAETADAVVAKLRELPLPLRAFPHGIAPAKTTPPPLPALEARRQHVYDELHALGPASVPALARALRDPDPEMRRDVAVALGVIGGGWWHFPDGDSRLDLRPALPALLTALQDSDPGVRAWAAQDISDMGEAAAIAVPRLRAMLRSPDPGSRGSACNALGRIGSGALDALPDLRQALHDSSPEVRRAAGDAIVSIGRAASLP
ncbi:MAG TPA: HEAT repeat domain-containing protein [Steroidobacteraceae bacterium]|nr:HEAT repeat domain-containing protein [Steroidobacteraceae bacterium]